MSTVCNDQNSSLIVKTAQNCLRHCFTKLKIVFIKLHLSFFSNYAHSLCDQNNWLEAATMLHFKTLSQKHGKFMSEIYNFSIQNILPSMLQSAFPKNMKHWLHSLKEVSLLPCPLHFRFCNIFHTA